MIHKNVLSDFKEKHDFSGRKIIDVKFSLKPGYILWQDAVRANKRAKQYRNNSYDSQKENYPQKCQILG